MNYWGTLKPTEVWPGELKRYISLYPLNGEKVVSHGEKEQSWSCGERKQPMGGLLPVGSGSGGNGSSKNSNIAGTATTASTTTFSTASISTASTSTSTSTSTTTTTRSSQLTAGVNTGIGLGDQFTRYALIICISYTLWTTYSLSKMTYTLLYIYNPMHISSHSCWNYDTLTSLYLS